MIKILVAFLAGLLCGACSLLPGSPPLAPVPDADTGGEGGVEVCRYLPSRSTIAQRMLAPRVVGGELAPEGAYPWMAAIETSRGRQYCGGTVIAPRWVLTAAHCQVQPGETAHVGTNDLREEGQRIEIVEVRNHESWTATPSTADVAVLRLESDAGVLPLELVSAAVLATRGVTIGWGSTQSGGSTVDELRFVDVPLTKREACLLAYPGKIDATMFCAGAKGVDSCQGDSGGPLVINDGGRPRQLGITSWGRGCAQATAPGVYTSVPAMHRWIKVCTEE